MKKPYSITLPTAQADLWADTLCQLGFSVFMTANEQEGKRQVNTMGTKEDLTAAWELFRERIQKLTN